MLINRRKNNILCFILVNIFFLTGGIYCQQDIKFELENIDFLGNENISSNELETVISSRKTPNWFSKKLFSWLGLGEGPLYFDSIAVANDVEVLNNYYMDNGFFETRIEYNYALDTNSYYASLSYIINEGEPAYLRKINVAGIENIHPEFQEYISELAIADTTQIYSRNYIEILNNDIISYLRNNGLMLIASGIPFVEIDTLQNSAVVDLSFTPGNRYKISAVRVSRTGPGKELVSDDLIKEIVNVQPDQYYNHLRLQQGQRRLYRTNLFSSALVAGITADTSENKVPLNISTDVNLLHELSPELIMNNEESRFNLGLSFSFIKRNFLGSARKLTISTSAASQDILEFLSNPSLSDTTITGYADARVILDQPFIFGEPIYTRLDNYITLQKQKNEYNMTVFGSKLSFDFELAPKVYLTGLQTYFNWENTHVYYQEGYLENLYSDFIDTNFPDITPEDRDSLITNAVEGSTEQITNNSIIGVDLNANKTNNLLFPSNGYSLNFVIEDGNLLPYLFKSIFENSVDPDFPLYYKILFKSALFPKIYFSDENAFGLKFTVGNIHTYRGDKFSIPFNQRFTSGGSNSVRGWGARELSPEISEYNYNLGAVSPEDLEAVIIRDATLGGYFLIEGSIETRNRIIGNIGGAVFLDYGNTFISADNFRFDRLAVAAGFGLRYYTEIIPIRIDIGFKIYDPNDPRSFSTRLNDPNVGFSKLYEIHLGIGEAF